MQRVGVDTDGDRDRYAERKGQIEIEMPNIARNCQR